MPTDEILPYATSPDILRRALILGVAGMAAGCESTVASVPETKLPPIQGLKTTAGWDVPGVDSRAMAGQVTVLNIWASWCPYCRSEHGVLKRLAGDGRFKLVGLVHRDTPEAARAYLQQAGNPFAALSVDDGKKIGAALGQRGVPNTYVIGRDLKVVLKIAGALSEDVVRAKLMPAVEKARST